MINAPVKLSGDLSELIEDLVVNTQNLEKIKKFNKDYKNNSSYQKLEDKQKAIKAEIDKITKIEQKYVKQVDEKRLEAVIRKEAIVDELRAYYEQHKHAQLRDSEGFHFKEYFSSCVDFLKSFELTPEIVSGFIQKSKTQPSETFDIYVSAMMQTCCNQLMKQGYDI